jgi:hypothetical protein
MKLIVNLKLKRAGGRQIDRDHTLIEFDGEPRAGQVIKCNVADRQVRAEVIAVSDPMPDCLPGGLVRTVYAEEI